MAWYDGQESNLRRLAADGYSASQIAALLDATSRNAVCGKLSRLGLSTKKKARSQYDKPKSEDPRRRASHLVRAPITETVVTMEYVEDSAIPMLQRKDLMGLTNSTCRWPVGDPCQPGFFYCGAEGADLNDRRPYCAHHASIAYNAPPTRVDKRPFRDA
jgi:GcrA cell cycle regulator